MCLMGVNEPSLCTYAYAMPLQGHQHITNSSISNKSMHPPLAIGFLVLTYSLVLSYCYCACVDAIKTEKCEMLLEN